MIWQALGHEPPVVGTRARAGQRAAQEAVEAARQGGARAVPRRGIPRRRDGQLPDDARLVARRASEIQPWPEMEAAFRLEDVNLSPAFFDLKKLAAFNGEYIRMLSVDGLCRGVRTVVARRVGSSSVRRDRPAHPAAARHAGRCARGGRLPVPRRPRDRRGVVGQDDDDRLRRTVARRRDRRLRAVRLERTTTLKATLEDVMARYELKLGKAQAPVRVAVTGRTVGPPLFEALEVMGRDESLRRMRRRARHELERLTGRRSRRCRRRGVRRRDQLRAAARRRRSVARPGGRARRRRRGGGIGPSWNRVLLGVFMVLSRVLRRHAGPGGAGRAERTIAEPVDAIVVLGAAQYDGRPSPQLAARLDHVVDVVERRCRSDRGGDRAASSPATGSPRPRPRSATWSIAACPSRRS